MSISICTKMCPALIWIVLSVLSKGVNCIWANLSIVDSELNSNTIVCLSTTTFQCQVEQAPTFQIEWLHGSTAFGICELTTNCRIYSDDLKTRYSLTKNGGNTVNNLTISPVYYNDSHPIICQWDGGTDSNSITPNVVARLVNSDITENTNVANGYVNIVATTNCVSNQNDVSIKLQYRQGSDAYENLIDSSDAKFVTSVTSTCTDAENPNCGGAATSKKVFTIKIPTNTNGQSYDVRLVYTDSGGSITREIGPFEIDITILEPSGGKEDNDLTTGEIIAIVCGCLAVLTVLIATALITWRYFETRNKRKEDVETSDEQKQKVTVSLQQIYEKVKTKTDSSKDIQETEELIRKIKGGLTTNSERTRNKDSKIVQSKVQLELQQILKEIGENKVRKDIHASVDDENLDDSIRQLRDLLSKIVEMESVEREGFGGKTNRKLPPIHSTKTATFHLDSP